MNLEVFSLKIYRRYRISSTEPAVKGAVTELTPIDQQPLHFMTWYSNLFPHLI